MAFKVTRKTLCSLATKKRSKQLRSPGSCYSEVVFLDLTSLVLYTSQVPHGGLLSVVRLAGVTRSRSDALVSNSV